MISFFRINNINELRLTRVFLVVSLFLLVSLKGWGQTATISGNATICQGSATPNITFTGVDGIAEYTFIYTINDGPQLTVSTTGGNSIVTLSVPTAAAGTFTYTLISATDGNSHSALITGINFVSAIVNPLPDVITGITNLCAGSTTTLSSATSGGTWSSDTMSVATVDPGTGVVTGLLSGTTLITYTLGTGCLVTKTLTVNPLPSTSPIYHQ
jgi:hypothetical protein